MRCYGAATDRSPYNVEDLRQITGNVTSRVSHLFMSTLNIDRLQLNFSTKELPFFSFTVVCIINIPSYYLVSTLLFPGIILSLHCKRRDLNILNITELSSADNHF